MSATPFLFLGTRTYSLPFAFNEAIGNQLPCPELSVSAGYPFRGESEVSNRAVGRIESRLQTWLAKRSGSGSLFVESNAETGTFQRQGKSSFHGGIRCDHVTFAIPVDPRRLNHRDVGNGQSRMQRRCRSDWTNINLGRDVCLCYYNGLSRYYRQQAPTVDLQRIGE